MAADPTPRRHQRVSVNLKVNLKFPDRQTFELRFAQNISQNGLFIRAKDPVPVGSRVRFEYLLADQSRVMRGVGVVRWVRTLAEAKEPEAPPGMGIEFIDIDPQTEQLITQIVAKHGDGPRAPKRVKAAATRRETDLSPPPVRNEVLEPEEEDLLSSLSEGGRKRAVAAAAAAAAASESGEPMVQVAGQAVAEAPAPAGEPALDIGADVSFDSSAVSGSATLAEAPAAAESEDDELDFEAAAEAAPPEPTGDLDSDLDDAFAGAAAADTPEHSDAGLGRSDSEPEASESAATTALTEASDAAVAEAPSESARSAALAAPESEASAAAGSALSAPSAVPASDAAAPEAAPTTQPVLIDLCCADILAASRQDGALRGQSTTTPRFTFGDSGLALDPGGALLPHLLSWLSPGWPTPRDRARARRLGLEVRTDSQRPAVRSGERVYEVAAALDAALAHTLRAHGRPRTVSVLIPSTASRQARAAVRESLKKLGVEQIILMDDAVAALHGAGIELGAGAHVLVVQPSLYETRIALIEGPDTLIAAGSGPDPCLADADAAVTRLAELALLREHQLDVGTDAALRRELIARAASIRRDGGEWSFELAGVKVDLGAPQLAAELTPLSERLAAQCAALLEIRQLEGKELHAVIMVADEPLWPGLAATLEEQLGIELSFANAGAWTRLTSVAASADLDS